MDSITQAVLGASIGKLVLGKKINNKIAVILGAIGGTIPDLDVLFLPLLDDLKKISFHRSYSHSILFCFLGAILFSLILKKVKWTSRISFTRLWVFSFLALTTHVLLDAFTTYGTQLFLPFANSRISFDSINIVDPFYTISLLGGLLLSLFLPKREKEKHRFYNKIGLVLSTAYLLFTLVNKRQIEKIFEHQLTEQNITFNELLTVPVKMGNMIWYGVAKDSDQLHIGKYSLLDRKAINFHSFPINDYLLNQIDSNLVQEMKWFAKGFYTVAEQEGGIRIYNLQCDMQGVRQYGVYKAPTAFYFEISQNTDKTYNLKSGMHNQILND